METITFENISVSGVKYTRLCNITIDQVLNDHATATIVCEMSGDEASEFTNRAKENTIIKIMTSAGGQHSVLFCGALKGIGTDTTGGYGLVTLLLKSTTIMLDLALKDQTFQQTSASYGTVMNKALSGSGKVKLNATDKTTGSIVIRYQETDWQFVKRMASQLGAVIYPSVASATPTIQVGISGGSPISLHQEGISQPDGINASTNLIQAKEYAYVGETVSCQGSSFAVSKVTSTMIGGRFISAYEATIPKTLQAKPTINQKSSGRMFLGDVMAVQGDKVQVNFTELDSSYDAGGDHWFPYSTAYASSDGSGLYLMPEVGDTVRVFMPSGNEKDAFACSSVNKNPQPNTRDKSWKAPGGKEVLLTDNGIYIICEKEKIFINLTKENGIQISSNKKIEITSDEGVVIQADNNLCMSAAKEISLEVGNSSVKIDEDKISMTANNVYVN